MGSKPNHTNTIAAEAIMMEKDVLGGAHERKKAQKTTTDGPCTNNLGQVPEFAANDIAENSTYTRGIQNNP